MKAYLKKLALKDHQIIESHVVFTQAAPARLSDYACGIFESLPSRKSVKKAIKRGELLVNGKESETGHWVQPGEVLKVVTRPHKLPVYQRELECVYQDNHIAVVVKPADLPVSGFQVMNLQNALAQNLTQSSEIDALSVPRPVHRLDRQTGGLIAIAKTRSAAASLGEQFETRIVEKRYAAIVVGDIQGDMQLSEPIDGREAITRVSVVKKLTHKNRGVLTLVEAEPETGRRNQIRIHLNRAGFPILGDLKFGGPHSGRGLFLFARFIRFKHPESGELLTFKMNLPGKFCRYFPK
ncbi:MAG: RluA family pseudouridine synthase [Cryomorphaceae bacterium]